MSEYNLAISFRNAKQEDVASAIRRDYADWKWFIAPETNGWVTVLGEYLDRYFIGDKLKCFAADVCKTCRAKAFALALFGSEIVCWYVYDSDGEIESFSAPEDFIHGLESPSLDEGLMQGLDGNLQSISNLVPGLTIGEIEKVLRQKSDSRVFPGQTYFDAFNAFHALVRLFGIPYASYTYEDLVSELPHLSSESLPELKRLVHLR